MKCHYCKDKATKSIDVTDDQNFAVGKQGDDDGVFFREETSVYDSQGAFRPWVDGGKDEAFSLHRGGEEEEEEEASAHEEEKAEIFVCEDHYRLWELWFGGESTGEGIKPEERQELEENSQKLYDEIEQIKERIRKKGGGVGD